MEGKTAIQEKIIQRISAILGISPETVNEDSKFIEDLNAKSGNMSQLVNFLEDEYDVEVAYMDFRRKKTVGQAAEYIAELLDE